MSFNVEDFHDLVRLLEERPEWRAELRRLVLTEELAALPKQLTELRISMDQRFQELAEAQAHTDKQIVSLTEQTASLTEQTASLTEQMASLTRTVGVLSDDVGELKGKSLEADYRARGHAYFSRLVRRPHVLSSDELVDLVEAARENGKLSSDEAQEMYEADAVVSGKSLADGTAVYLVVEVSWGVGSHDVERARRRAALLSQTGTLALPVVAGKWVTPEAAQLAHSQQVWQVTNGKTVAP